jgi:hypothetical protein
MTLNQTGGQPSALYLTLSLYCYVIKAPALQRRMQPKFGVEEKVLCYHGPLLYEAKILKMKKDGGVFTYFVHYQASHAYFIFFLLTFSCSNSKCPVFLFSVFVDDNRNVILTLIMYSS